MNDADPPSTPTPGLDLDMIREFGPYRAYATDIRVDSGVEPDRYVKTHCCFCGQQCGMQLKVKDNVIMGVEPWYDFPFNRGMMCPKGVKRYLQQAHPDRLLHARGRYETWFLGASTVAGVLRDLVPTAQLRSAERLSRLSFVGDIALGQLPSRSAAVAFSMPAVYALAERLRARHGGVAVVLGALSPRTRNAQVAMYQAGEVDHLVATDAIGMGLNMDLDHVAFADQVLDLAEGPAGTRAPCGSGEGEGWTLNIPMPPGATGEHYRRSVDEVVASLHRDVLLSDLS